MNSLFLLRSDGDESGVRNTRNVKSSTYQYMHTYKSTLINTLFNNSL